MQRGLMRFFFNVFAFKILCINKKYWSSYELWTSVSWSPKQKTRSEVGETVNIFIFEWEPTAMNSKKKGWQFARTNRRETAYQIFVVTFSDVIMGLIHQDSFCIMWLTSLTSQLTVHLLAFKNLMDNRMAPKSSSTFTVQAISLNNAFS